MIALAAMFRVVQSYTCTSNSAHRNRNDHRIGRHDHLGCCSRLGELCQHRWLQIDDVPRPLARLDMQCTDRVVSMPF